MSADRMRTVSAVSGPESEPGVIRHSRTSVFPQRFKIGKVSFTAQGSFVGYEVISADIGDRYIPKGTFHPARSGLFPRNPGNRGHDVYPDRWKPELNDLAFQLEIRRCQANRPKPKLVKSLYDPPCVGRLRLYKNVKVTRVPGDAMKPQRISPHDDVINLVFVEQLEQISEVLLYFRDTVVADSLPPRPFPEAFYLASTKGPHAQTRIHSTDVS